MANVRGANGYIPIPEGQSHAENNQTQAIVARNDYYIRRLGEGGVGTPLGGLLGWGALCCVPLVVPTAVIAAPVSAVVITVASIAGALIGWYYGSRADRNAFTRDSNIQHANNLLRQYPDEDGPIEVLVGRITELEKYWKANFSKIKAASDILRNRQTDLKHRLSNLFKRQLEQVGVECVRSKDHENLCRLFVDLEYQLTNQFRIDARRILRNIVAQPDIAAKRELEKLIRELLEKNYLEIYHQTKSLYSMRHLELDILLDQKTDLNTDYLSSMWTSLSTIAITGAKAGATLVAAAAVAIFTKNQHAFDVGIGVASTTALNSAWTDLQAHFGSAPTKKDQFKKLHNLLKANSENEVDLNQDTRLPRDIKQRICSLDDSIDSSVERNDLTHARRLLYRRQGMLLSFPTETKALRLSGTDRDTEEHREFVVTVDENIERLIRTYEDRTAENMRNIINNIRGNSILSHGPNAGFVREQIYLVGLPGVGKTHFVTNLAIALGVPMFKCSLASRDDIEDLFPRGSSMPIYFDALTQGDSNDKKIMSIIPYSLTKSGCLNPIIFFDEAGQFMGTNEQPRGNIYNPYDTAFIEKLKQLFDRNNKTLPLECIGADFSIDFSRATIICAGNTAPSAESPLGSRFNIIELPPLSAATKRVIAQITIKEAMIGIDERYRSEVSRLAGVHIDTILDIDRDTQTPGAHRLKNAIASFIVKLHNSLIDNQPVTEDHVRGWMDTIYRQQD